MDSKKTIKILVFVAIFLMASLFIFETFLKEESFSFIAGDDNKILETQQYNSLSYNGNPLIDHTIFTQEEIQQSNAILGGNYGMYAMISPAYAQDIDGQNIEVDMEFSYIPFLQEGALSHLNAPNNNPRNVSIVLVFEGELIKGDALLKKNVSYEYKYGSSENAWINNREVLYDSYVDLGTPDDSCVYGNDNNTRMFAVTYQGNTTNYCFTNFSPNGQGNVLLSGNYNKPIDVIETRWEEKYVNVRDRFQFMGNNLLGNNFSFYRAENIYFEENDTYELKLIFTPKDREKNGKWHIVMYETEYGLINSINDQRYTYLDPFWNASWSYKKQITNITGNIITLKVDYNANMNSTYKDLRFVNSSEDGELPYAIIFSNTSEAIVKVQTNGSSSIYMYYGNPSAEYVGNIQGVYPPNLTYALFFDNGYNESVTGKLLTTEATDSFNYSYRNSTFWVYNQSGYNYPAPYGLHGLTPSSPAEFTFVSNIYPMSAWDGGFGAGGTISAFQDGAGGYKQKYFQVLNNGGAKLQMVIGDGGSSAPTGQLAINLNQWSYVVGQGKVGTGSRVYLNGNTTVNTAVLGAMGTSASVLDIGVYKQSGGNQANAMNGSIDYWLYFTRFLDVNEVGYLKEQTSPYAVFGAEQTDSVAGDSINITTTLISPTDNTPLNVNYTEYFGTFDVLAGNITNYTLYIYRDGSVNSSKFFDILSSYSGIESNLTTSNTTDFVQFFNVTHNNSDLGLGITTNKTLNTYLQSGVGGLGATSLAIPKICSQTSEITIIYEGDATSLYTAKCLNVTNGITTIGSVGSAPINKETFNIIESNVTYSLIVGNTSQNFTASTIDLEDGDYQWNVYGCAENSTAYNCSYAGANYSFEVHTGSPRFTLNSYINTTTITLPTNTTINVTTTDPHIDTCMYFTSDSSTNITYTCNTTQIVNFTSGGIKTVYFYANDTFGNENTTSYNVYVYDFNVTQYENIDPIAEGSTSNIYLLVNSTSFPITDASAVITWNGTQYSASSKDVLDTNSILFTYSFTVTSGMGNTTGVPYSYNWTYNTTQLSTRTTPTVTQSVIVFGIDDCSVYGIEIANFSIKDEETTNYIYEVNVSGTNIEIDVISTSIDNPEVSWDYSNTFVNQSSFVLCVPDGTLNNTNFTVDITLGYDADNHVREFFFLDNGTIYQGMTEFNSHTDNNISLYDLITTDSTTFLFEFTDEDGLDVPDAIVHTFRKYIGEGVFREVERSREDNNGQTHVHLVEEDVIYYFMITQYGQIIYTSDTYNAKCLSSPCQITLSASPQSTNWSIIDNEGGRYSVNTNKDTRIVTTYFSLDTVSLVNASIYEIDSDGQPNLVNTSSLTATSGNIPLLVPLSYGNKSYFVVVYNDNERVESEWVELVESGNDYFGTSGAIFGGLIVLALILMAVSEGVGLIIFAILGIIVIVAMALVDLGWLSIISIIVAGAIIIFKLVKRRQQA